MENENFSILIIDDDQERSAILRLLLLPLDFSLDIAYTGAEGLNKVFQKQPEMVLLDVKLPDINGFDVLRHIKSDAANKDCFVIIISSVLISSEDQSQGFESGADGYLVFPLSNREFTARIQAFARHKQTIDKLRNSESRLKTVLENTADGVIVINHEGKITFANTVAQRMFANTAGEMENLFFGHPLTNSEKTVIDIPGKDGVITAEMQVVEYGSGHQKVSIVTLYDVTPHRLLKESMTEQIDLLLSKERHQDKMFSMIAHDLRSPFNILLNLSESIIEDNEEMSRVDILRHLGSIHTSSQRIFNLLINLLDWSRIKTGNWRQYPEIIDLNGLTAEVMNLYDDQAIKKSISLINKVTPSVKMYADKNILHSLLRNLVGNAIKFTERAGFVVVDATRDDFNLIVAVSDNGAGMSEEKLNKLFDQDYVGEKSHQESGTGLGLMLCKELVEIAGGKLEITSQINKGTTVKCIFGAKN